jgi:hypothetical protein
MTQSGHGKSAHIERASGQTQFSSGASLSRYDDYF